MTSSLPLPALEAATVSPRTRLRTIVVAHGVADFYQAAIPALVPFFMARHALGFERGGRVVLALTVLSSVLQPVFGWLADAAPRRWMATLGLLLTAAGLTLALLAPDYGTTLLSVLLLGVGVAAFHPEATRAVHALSATNRATSMSLFSLGGNVGFAVAPMAVVPLVGAQGWRAAWVGLLALPVAVAMQRALHGEQTEDLAGGTRHDTSAVDDWRAFTLLGLTVAVRSVMALGLITFLPLWWKGAHADSASSAARVTSFMLLVGLVGTLLGGRLADRVGVRPVVATAFGIAGPALLLLVWAPSTMLALAVLSVVGLVLWAPMASLVVLGQSYLPTRVGMASGVTTGLAVTIGGIAAPLLGTLADHHGLRSVLLVLAALAPIACALALALPAAPRARDR